MLRYSCKLVLENLREVCAKFIKTKDIKIKKIRYSSDEKRYEITLHNGSIRLLEQEIINKYIESLGEENALKIAGHLSHDVSLEESVSKLKSPITDEFWEGNMDDVQDYINKKDENNP